MGCALFAKIVQHLQIARPGNEGIPLAGINIVTMGDFHQIVPVGDTALINPDALQKPNSDVELGYTLFSQLTTAVELKEHVRVTDIVWQELLDRMRYGICRPTDESTLRGLELKVSFVRFLVPLCISLM